MESFISRLEAHARTRAHAPAVVFAGGSLSYGELWSDVRSAAGRLAASGIAAGDTVALLLDADGPADLRSLPVLYALGYLGAVVLPLQPEVPAANRAALMQRFGAARTVSAGSLAGAAPARRGDAAQNPFLYVFTSGTTGDIKACLLGFGQLTAHRLQYAELVGTGPGDCLAGPLSWPTKPGLRSLLRIHAAGGAFASMAFPETHEALEAMMREQGVTELLCTPWQLRRLLGAAPLPGLSALRLLQVGGSDVSAEELEAARRTLTPRTFAVYAATELGVLAHLPPGRTAACPGHAGALLPAVEGQAVDDADRPLAPGEVGRLRFRTSTMPREYAANPEASARAFRDGWFYPGDLGSIDAGRQVLLRGRAEEVVNFGGLKIAPETVEAVLRAHPDIADAALVGIPHPMAGEVPVAFVVFRRATGATALRRYLAERLDANRIPLEILAVSRIPRDAQGKILRGALRNAHENLARGPAR